MEWWLADTSTSLATVRREFGLVDAQAALISPVADTLACRTARAHYHARINASIPSTPVSLLRISPTRYAVGDSATRVNLGAFALTDRTSAVLAFIPY